ncbi:hypothetical protein [Corynebacterium cystitidis]|nr:hypothetical protein [Corynebacterium cystitidis]
MRGIQKAKRRAGGPNSSPGKIISELSLDFWVRIFDRRHRTTIHPKLVSSIKHAHSISDFKTKIDPVYKLRNRCAHHEPLVKTNLLLEEQNVNEALAAIETVTRWINPQASNWIMGNSRVKDLYARRP